MTTTFAELSAAYLDAAMRQSPVFATAIGDHRFDDRWPDVGPTAVADRLAHVAHWDAEFAALDRSTLTADEAIDLDLIRMELAAERFSDEDLQEERWNPLDWVYLMGDGLFTLLSSAGKLIAVPDPELLTVHIALICNGSAYLLTAATVWFRIPEISGRAQERRAASWRSKC